ncbi:hypothetical protein BJ508DRAFT_308572 [Ascobolus immersus RN42]|uniref:Uncharacterized protein n=1 Tax=Ascobolus immersus RN42 TaxID=1160509 RepID=A0A3N4HZ68_ASCIM|nr:hypothetical protein BJ508DRAFT_308572 [Ascobolus immersus RN42]
MEDLYTVVATRTPPGQSTATSEVLGIYRSLEEANDEARRAVAPGTLDNEEEGAEFDDFGCIRFYDVHVPDRWDGDVVVHRSQIPKPVSSSSNHPTSDGRKRTFSQAGLDDPGSPLTPNSSSSKAPQGAYIPADNAYIEEQDFYEVGVEMKDMSDGSELSKDLYYFRNKKSANRFCVNYLDHLAKLEYWEVDQRPISEKVTWVDGLANLASEVDDDRWLQIMVKRVMRKVIKNADLERVTKDDMLELPIVEYLPIEDAVVENPRRAGSGRSDYGDDMRSQRGVSPPMSAPRGGARRGLGPGYRESPLRSAVIPVSRSFLQMESSIILSFLQFLLTYLLLAAVGVFSVCPPTSLTNNSLPTSPVTSIEPNGISEDPTTGWNPDFAVLSTPFSSLQTKSAFLHFGDGSMDANMNGWSDLTGWNRVKEEETTSVDPLEGFIPVYEDDLKGPASPVETGWTSEGGMWDGRVLDMMV